MSKLGKAALQTAWTKGRLHGHGRSVPREPNCDDLFDSVVLTDGTNPANSFLLNEQSALPPLPIAGAQNRVYLRDGKLTFMFTDETATHLKSLDLIGTGVTWEHTSFSLSDTLVAYWPGDEASGNLLDAHTNEVDLTDKGSVTNNTGLVYATARQFTAANHEYFSTYPVLDTDLTMGAVDFTVAAWVYLDSSPEAASMIIARRQLEWYLAWVPGMWPATDPSYFKFWISSPDEEYSYCCSWNLGGVPQQSPALNTWYLVIGWYDAANERLYLQVNDDEPNVQSPPSLDAPIQYGGYLSVGAGVEEYEGAEIHWGHLDGRIGPVMVWKSTPGGGGVLTAEQRAALYNGGLGLPYANLIYSAPLWWLEGGFAPEDCVAAYAPDSAVDLAASYINLANPGTYNAAPGVAPTLDVDGWVFNGSTQYLLTGIVPSSGWTLAIQFSDHAEGGDVYLGGSYSGGNNGLWLSGMYNSGNTVGYASGTRVAVAPKLLAGNLIVSGTNGYRDGVLDTESLTGVVSEQSQIAIGCILVPAAYGFVAVKIKKLAIYNKTITSGAQALALATAMAA